MFWSQNRKKPKENRCFDPLEGFWVNVGLNVTKTIKIQPVQKIDKIHTFFKGVAFCWGKSAGGAEATDLSAAKPAVVSAAKTTVVSAARTSLVSAAKTSADQPQHARGAAARMS